MATKIIELPEITTTDDNDLLLVYDGVTQALSKMKANQLVAGTGVIDGLKLKMIHLPDEYGDFNNVKWETVLKDHADGHDIAYFIIEGKGSIFKNIDLTFNSVSDYWAITSVTKDPDSGAWGQRVSFATRGDWTDNGRTFQRSGNNATNAKLTGFRKFAFTTDVPKTQPHIGNTFLGIYDDLQALQSAVSSPKAGMQAIVLQPEEDYYHVSGGQWVKLAKVQDVHAQYLGAYSTLSALRTTYPSANAGDIAIVGKGWYKYDTSWEAVGSTDLGDINSKLTRLDNDIINLQDDIKDFVAGPSSSKQGELVAFDGVTGKIVKGSGVELTSDGKISSNYIPYVDTPTDIVNMPIEDTNLRQTDNFNKFKNKVAYYTSTRRGAIGFPAWSSQGDDFPVGTKFAFYTQSTVGSAYTLSIILNRDDSLDSGATRLYLPPYTFIVIEKLPINNK